MQDGESEGDREGEGDAGSFADFSFPSLRDATTATSGRQTLTSTGNSGIKKSLSSLGNLSSTRSNTRPDTTSMNASVGSSGDPVPFPHLDGSDSPSSPNVVLPHAPYRDPAHAPIPEAGAFERRLSVDSLLHGLRHAGGLHHSTSEQDLRGRRPAHIAGLGLELGYPSRLHAPDTNATTDTATDAGATQHYSYEEAVCIDAESDVDADGEAESATRPSRLKTPPQYIHARRISNIYHFDSVGKVPVPRVAPRPRSISVTSDGEGSPVAGRGEVLQGGVGVGMEGVSAGFTFGSAGTGMEDMASPHGRGAVLERSESPVGVGRTIGLGLGLGLGLEANPTTDAGRVVLPPYQGPLPVPVVSVGEEDAQWPERKRVVSVAKGGYAPEQYFMEVHQHQHQYDDYDNGHTLVRSHPYSHSHSQPHSQEHAHSSVYHAEHQHASQQHHRSHHASSHRAHQSGLEVQHLGPTRRQLELGLVPRHGHGHRQVHGDSGGESGGERERDLPPERNRIDVGKIERGEETRTTVSVSFFLLVALPSNFILFIYFVLIALYLFLARC